MRVLAILSFVGWVGGTLAGCRTTTPPEPPLHGEPEALPAPKPAPAVAPAPEPPAPRDDDLVEDDAALLEVLMKSHFGETVLIRRAIIAGDIDAAIPPAEAIAGLEDEARLPEPWKTRVGELKAASDRIRQAPDLPEAAAAMADIGKSCAGCHLELGGPTFDPEPEPVPPAGDLVARMKRHVWASERLWEGLVGPSEAAWREGAAALVEGPLPDRALAPGGVHARSLAGRFATLAHEAKSATTLEARSDTYASLLATCSPCHESVGQPRERFKAPVEPARSLR